MPVTLTIHNLQAGTAYRFQLVAANDEGTKAVLGPQFTTLPPIAVTTDPATDIQQTQATFNGSVNPLGATLSDCHFEYGLTNSYGTSIPCDQTGVGSAMATRPCRSPPRPWA